MVTHFARKKPQKTPDTNEKLHMPPKKNCLTCSVIEAKSSEYPVNYREVREKTAEMMEQPGRPIDKG